MERKRRRKMENMPKEEEKKGRRKGRDIRKKVEDKQKEGYKKINSQGLTV